MKKTIRYLCKLAADRGSSKIKINAWDTVKQKLNNDEYWIECAEQLVNKSYYCKDRLGIEFVTISPEDVIVDETEVVMPSILLLLIFCHLPQAKVAVSSRFLRVFLNMFHISIYYFSQP